VCQHFCFLSPSGFYEGAFGIKIAGKNKLHYVFIGENNENYRLLEEGFAGYGCSYNGSGKHEPGEAKECDFVYR
jgi:hypothetical protein